MTTKEFKSASSALAVLCNKKSKHFIFDEKIIIGRSLSAAICITDNQISRKHCTIEKTEDNKFVICDTSNYGTFVNDVRLVKNQPQELRHLDRIRLAELEAYSYVFLLNKRNLGVKTTDRINKSSPLTEKMIDLNETQSSEIDSMNQELNLKEKEVCRLKEEMQQKLKDREDELERERMKISMESASSKEQANKAHMMVNELTLEKERVTIEYEQKIADVTNKVEELQNSKIEMCKRHQMEREELEKKCKAEIEELKKKLEHSETKHQQFEELQSRLEETKSILLESEMEQQRLFEAKVEVETKLESKILDLTNEKNNQEEQVKELEKKLKEKEEQEERVKKEIEGLEDDMMCSICAELYIEPTALNCGHMFCKVCITEWSKKKKICPMCRAHISSSVRIFNMDSVIQRNVALMSEEVRARRECLIAQRKKEKTPQKKQSAKKRRHESSRGRTRAVSPDAVPARRRATLDIHGPADTPPLRIRAVVVPDVPRLPQITIPLESEGDDPFQAGWVTAPRQMRTLDRNSPVPVAAVDLTNLPSPVVTLNRTRSHTVTSRDVNTTIDLTNL